MADAESPFFATRDPDLALYLYFKDPYRDEPEFRAFVRMEERSNDRPVFLFRYPEHQARLKRQYNIDFRPYVEARAPFEELCKSTLINQ